jgi:hypothetical protein
VKRKGKNYRGIDVEEYRTCSGIGVEDVCKGICTTTLTKGRDASPASIETLNGPELTTTHLPTILASPFSRTRRLLMASRPQFSSSFMTNSNLLLSLFDLSRMYADPRDEFLIFSLV